MLAVNSLTFIFYVLSGAKAAAAFPNAPSWFPYILAMGCAFNVVLTIFIFRWKKWAFYAFCASAGVIFFVNLSIGVPLFGAVLGLVGPALLYGVLQIGDANKGWPPLK